MRIRADPDPDPKPCFKDNSNCQLGPWTCFAELLRGRLAAGPPPLPTLSWDWTLKDWVPDEPAEVNTF